MSGNEAQAEFWNSSVGLTWADLQAQLDRQLQPLGAAGLDALSPQPGEVILDIGCGCGDTSFALAEAVGPAGFVLGLDISEPMLDVARQRAAESPVAPDFLRADAQTADLGAARFDAAFSRFGVMFFSDPTAAFANIRHMLKPGGRLAFVCWRSPMDNPWMSVPVQSALPFLPPQPERDPLAPGPFAFADADRVRGILADAGFAAITVTPYDALIGSGDLEETLALTGRVGPLASVLRDNPGLASSVLPVVRAALSAYLTPDGVMMPAAVWIVSAANR
jgi:SAM-dependent methyltransferase